MRARARARLIPLVAAWLLAGCASTHWSEEWATRVAQVYGVPRAQMVLLGDVKMEAAWATYHAGPPPRIVVSPAVWWAPAEQQVRLLAHEFGHHVLGHRNISPENEITADIKGVEILQRIEGLSEREAFRIFYDHRWSRIRWVQRRTPAGHPDECVRLAALIMAYPAQRAWARGCE